MCYANLCDAFKSDVISREDVHALKMLKSSSRDLQENRVCIVPFMDATAIARKTRTESFIFLIFQRLQKALKKRRDATFGSTFVSARISLRQGVHGFVHYTSALMPNSNSPEFLKSIDFTDTRRIKLKNNAVPTENKPLQDAENEGRITAKRSTGTLSRRRVGHDMLRNTTCCRSALYFILCGGALIAYAQGKVSYQSFGNCDCHI